MNEQEERESVVETEGECKKKEERERRRRRRKERVMKDIGQKAISSSLFSDLKIAAKNKGQV